VASALALSQNRMSIRKFGVETEERSERMDAPISSVSSWFWSDSFSSVPGWMIVLLSGLAIITFVMWVFLPFAIYGAKTILRAQNTQLAEIRILLKKAIEEIESSNPTEPQVPDNVHDADSKRDPK
jgi:hypothetical protein